MHGERFGSFLRQWGNLVSAQMTRDGRALLPEGFRLLQAGEKTRDGDRVLHDGEWRAVAEAIWEREIGEHGTCFMGRAWARRMMPNGK